MNTINVFQVYESKNKSGLLVQEDNEGNIVGVLTSGPDGINNIVNFEFIKQDKEVMKILQESLSEQKYLVSTLIKQLKEKEK